MSKSVLLSLACSALIHVAALPARADELTVAVASNFSAPMNAIAEQFEAESGHRLRLVFGSSGRFHAQISNGAPFQLFFSADQAKPIDLEQKGLALAGSRITYAIGRLVLWSAGAVDLADGAAVLRRGQFNRLALANPRLAPYGEAAREVLTNLDLLPALEGKIVQGENIAQTYQFVASGNAELGFVALSQLQGSGRPGAGSGWTVPRELHNPILQDAVILGPGADSTAARQLLDFVGSPRGRQLIQGFGYAMEED